MSLIKRQPTCFSIVFWQSRRSISVAVGTTLNYRQTTSLWNFSNVCACPAGDGKPFLLRFAVKELCTWFFVANSVLTIYHFKRVFSDCVGLGGFEIQMRVWPTWRGTRGSVGRYKTDQRQCINNHIVDNTDDDCEQRVPSVALRFQQLSWPYTGEEVCYLMTTLRCPSDFVITSWLFTARWSTWLGNHLVPCVAELVGSCIPIHAHRCLPDPNVVIR